MTDIHQHVLYGMDDGPETPEQMYAMLENDVREGITLVYATVHADALLRSKGIARYTERLNEANAYCESKGLPLRLVKGCEIRYFDSVPDLLSNRKLLNLDASRYVLVEFDYDVTPERIGKASDALYSAGFFPVVAHVERYANLVRDPERAMRLREQFDLKYQVNSRSVLNPHGFRKRRFLRKLLESRSIDVLATDAHDIVSRPAQLKAAYEKISADYGETYANYLTHFDNRV